MLISSLATQHLNVLVGSGVVAAADVTVCRILLRGLSFMLSKVRKLVKCDTRFYIWKEEGNLVEGKVMRRTG